MMFHKLPAYHKIKFWNIDALGQENMADTLDSIHVQPSQKDKKENTVLGRSDMVLVNNGTGRHSGVKGV